MSEKAKKALKELKDLVKEISILSSCESLLAWDERTYMPSQGAEHRAKQHSLLSGISHEKFISPKVGELLREIENGNILDDPLSADAVNIRELRRHYDKKVKIPKSLVEEISETTTLAEHAWIEARQKSDFSLFSSWLEKVTALKRQQAEAVGYEKEPYDALLDDYEPGETSANIEKVFGDFRRELVPLVSAIADSDKKPDVAIMEREYPVEKQKIFNETICSSIGFNFEGGRIDLTTHPFCITIGPGDVRITTRYNKNHFGQAFFGAVHESGHGLYEQGLDHEYYGLPMGSSVSLGIHESQSRMWENMVGRSRAFWAHFFPRAQRLFPDALKDVSLDDFYFAINDVRPSYIRVEADEATYNLHILLRFEIEHAMFSGDLKIKDIPGTWNDKFKSYFGITPPDDARGCLQDIHWGGGLMGYFPTYALGNLYAAQFFAQAKKELSNLDEKFASGSFKELLGWLREKIHKHGMRYKAGDLVKQVTGKPLSHKYLIDYLKQKFAPLYGI